MSISTMNDIYHNILAKSIAKNINRIAMLIIVVLGLITLWFYAHKCWLELRYSVNTKDIILTDFIWQLVYYYIFETLTENSQGLLSPIAFHILINPLCNDFEKYYIKSFMDTSLDYQEYNQNNEIVVIKDNGKKIIKKIIEKIIMIIERTCIIIIYTQTLAMHDWSLVIGVLIAITISIKYLILSGKDKIRELNNNRMKVNKKVEKCTKLIYSRIMEFSIMENDNNMFKLLKKQNELIINAELKWLASYTKDFCMINFLRNIIIVLCVIYYMIITNDYDSSSMITIMTCIGIINKSFNVLLRYFNDVSNIQKEVQPIIDKVNEFKPREKFKQFNMKESLNNIQLKMVIDLDNFQISSNIIRFKRGSRHMVVGSSGSGKTTFFSRGIGGTIDQNNVINEFIKVNNHTLKSVKSIQSHTWVVRQKPSLNLHNSIKDIFELDTDIDGNITPASKLKIDKLFQICELTKDFKREYTTPLNNNVSGGQEKRIYLAYELMRMFERIQNGKEIWFLILDEIDAGLKEDSDGMIYRIIRNITELPELSDSIIINIAHHTKSIKCLFDHVWDVKDGVVMNTKF